LLVISGAAGLGAINAPDLLSICYCRAVFYAKLYTMTHYARRDSEVVNEDVL